MIVCFLFLRVFMQKMLKRIENEGYNNFHWEEY